MNAHEKIFDRVSDLTDKIESQIKFTVDQRGKIAPLFAEISAHHFGWNANDSRVQSRGKRVRPLMTMLVGKALGGDEPHLLPCAAGIEITHNFTLIHDDIMDESTERRHRPTAWTIWGIGQAINTGDGLFALSYKSILDTLKLPSPPETSAVVDVIAFLTEALLNTAEGQMLDVSFEKRDDVSVEEYLLMIFNKSGTLIECAAKCGARLSTDNPYLIDAYAGFARNLGIAFQIRDDYLGIWGEEGTTGKPSAIDILERKKTLPVIWGLAQAEVGSRNKVREIYLKEKLSVDDVDFVQHKLRELGADSYTKSLAMEYYNTALDHLNSTGIKNEAQDMLRSLAAFLIERDF
jgi:geranylgeranyl diphosphate synthase, type I